MNDENYIHIGGWMINRLHLKGNELLAYAVIYGFTQDGVQWYKGSSRYLSELLQVSRPTAIKILDSLVEKGLILKMQEEVNEVKFNRYKITEDPIKNFNRGYKETLQGDYKKSLQGDYKETLHKEILNKGNDNNRKDNRNKKEPYYPLDEKLNEAFEDFVEFRKRIKAPLATDKAITLNMNKLAQLSNGDNDVAIRIINQTIQNGWKGLYPLKEESKQKPMSQFDYLMSQMDKE